MAGFTSEEYTDMLVVYGMADCNGREARRIYQERYPNRRVPNHQTFGSTYRRLRETGNLNFREPAVNRFQPNLAAEERILAEFEEDPTRSVRTVARTLGLSVWKVWSVLRENGCHPFHYTPVQGIRAVGRALEYALPYSNMASVKAKINFNTKHLQKGDPLPPYNGKLRVYNMRYCPFAQRTILALNAKEIDYEVVNIDLKDKPEWLHTKSAFTKVPALEIADGVSIYESLVTVEYLDDVYPQRPLLPKDPVKKAFDKIIVEAIGPVHSLFYKVIVSPELVNENGMAAYYKALDFIQDQLKQRGTTFLDGEQPGYADYMIWPWFERILDLDRPEIKIHEDKYKVLLDYLANMLKDPAVSQYLVPKEVFLTYLEAYTQKKKPNYDALLEE